MNKLIVGNTYFIRNWCRHNIIGAFKYLGVFDDRTITDHYYSSDTVKTRSYLMQHVKDLRSMGMYLLTVDSDMECSLTPCSSDANTACSNSRDVSVPDCFHITLES